VAVVTVGITGVELTVVGSVVVSSVVAELAVVVGSGSGSVSVEVEVAVVEVLDKVGSGSSGVASSPHSSAAAETELP
jgi:hypothetical protein